MNAVPAKELELLPKEQATVDSFERQTKWTIRSAAALAITGLLAALLGCWLFGAGDIDSPSALGDFVAGTAGPLWAVAGVLLVYLAFVGQRVQIVYQQAELRATRAEFSQQTDALSGQREEMERQVLEARRQTFDNAFFQMLRLYTGVLGEIDVQGAMQGNGNDVRGRDAFEELRLRLQGRYSEHLEGPAELSLSKRGIHRPESGSSPDTFPTRLGRYKDEVAKQAEVVHEEMTLVERRNAALAAYRGLYSDNQREIGHYFRTLYHVVKFIDRADPSAVKDKQRYASIVRSQLSSPELVLLAYNGLTHGREKFKPLMERYGLLKQMPTDDLADSLLSEYASEAFGRKDTGTSEVVL